MHLRHASSPVDLQPVETAASGSRANAVRRILLLVALVLSGVTVVLVLEEYVVGDREGRLAATHWLIASCAATLGVVVARSRCVPSERAGWNAMLVATATWAAAALLWDAYIVLDRFPPTPSPADLLWLVSTVAATVGVRSLGSREARVTALSWMELAPLGVVVLTLLTTVLWQDLETSPLPLLSIATALSYPVLYVCTALVMLQAVISGSLRLRHDPGLALVLAGLIAEAVAFTAWSGPLLQNSYVTGQSWIDGVWSLGMVLIAAGAACRRPVSSLRPEATPVRGGLLPTLSFLLLSGFQIERATQADRMSDLGLSIGIAVTGLLLSLRGTILLRTNRLLRRDSRTDGLMGIGNRLRLEEDLALVARRFSVAGDVYSLILFDLDRFKAYNDLLGHRAGDLALQSVAMLLDGGGRSSDRTYRYGGEELLVLLPHTEGPDAERAANRLVEAVAAAAIPHPGNDAVQVVTVSAGVATVRAGETPSACLERADQALYAAKQAGRNRVGVDA